MKRALKMLGRYLIGRIRYVVTFQRQCPNNKMHTQVNTDRAGCLKTKEVDEWRNLQVGQAHD